MSYIREQSEGLSFHLLHIAGLAELCQLEPFTHADQDTVTALLETAADFAGDQLLPLAASGDRAGCQLDGTGVRLPPGTQAIYQAWCDLGFPALGLPQDIDGLGLPRVVVSAVQELCDGANLAFGMLCINLRCAALAIRKSANDSQKARWLAGLVSGNLSSTIAISEAQAGSDAGRISTVARLQADGSYQLTGSKIWISYGDHDVTAEILHLVLARIPGAEIGSRGLSLFAAPKTLDGIANGVNVLRLEHKMGLHASPTCVLEFNDAKAELVGEPGKGLQALFVMMNSMRLAVAVQGAAIANAATIQAIKYAAERPQGGSASAPPINIIEHADVRRMLLEMTAESELMRALALRIASFLDNAEAGAAAANPQAHDWQSMAELMLPVAKTYNAETAFTVANLGIQVMGGYGYTSDYPMERMARDIRVAAIYEGTSGIQAMDFVKRKVLADNAVTLNRLLSLIDAAMESGASPFQTGWACVRALLTSRVTALLAALQQQPKADNGSAYAMLQLTALVLHCWNGHCLYSAASDSVLLQQRLRTALVYFAGSVTAKAALWANRSESEIPSIYYAK